jgi:hypothetical protein
MSISQTATKKDKKHGIQRRFQDALARFQVEEPARLLIWMLIRQARI